MLGILKSKSKLFLGVAGVTSVIALGLWWYSGNLKEQLGAIQARESQLEQSLKDEKKANDVLWAEINRTNRIVKENREQKAKIQEEMKELNDVLQEEKKSNKALNECLSVDLGDYGKRLREQTASKDGSEESTDSSVPDS